MKKRIMALMAAATMIVTLGSCAPKNKEVSTNGTTQGQVVNENKDTLPSTTVEEIKETTVEVKTDGEKKTDGNNNSSSSQGDEVGEGNFSIYSKDPKTNEKVVLKKINIDDALPLEGKLSALAETLSVEAFEGTPIEVGQIKEEDGKKVVSVDLKGKEAWNKFFQGTTGGALTQTALIDTFLQREFKGEWIDGVTFTLDGEQINSDHVPGLSDTRFRIENRN